MRWFALFASLFALMSSGCVVVQTAQRDDDSERIDQSMKPELFTAETPGAQGIRLGDDAPPLAQWTAEDDEWIRSGPYVASGMTHFYFPGLHGMRVQR